MSLSLSILPSFLPRFIGKGANNHNDESSSNSNAVVHDNEKDVYEVLDLLESGFAPSTLVLLKPVSKRLSQMRQCVVRCYVDKGVLHAECRDQGSNAFLLRAHADGDNFLITSYRDTWAIALLIAPPSAGGGAYTLGLKCTQCTAREQILARIQHTSERSDADMKLMRVTLSNVPQNEPLLENSCSCYQLHSAFHSSNITTTASAAAARANQRNTPGGRKHQNYNRRHSSTSDSENDGGSDGEQVCNKGETILLRSKRPVYNSQLGAYTLDFRGRVKQSSPRNFQLETEGRLVLQFGLVDTENKSEKYILDFAYPLCPLRAFAIALSTSVWE